MSSHYFAYGSNMSQGQMARRCPGAVVVGSAVLPGFQLYFPRRSERWGGGVAGIQAKDNGRVEGALWRVTSAHLAMLDAYEGVSECHYTRGRVRIEAAAMTSMVWTYFAVSEPGGPFDPSAVYLATMVRGASDFKLSGDYRERLGRLSVIEGTGKDRAF